MVDLLLVLMVEALLAIRGQAGDPELKMTAVSRTAKPVDGSYDPARLRSLMQLSDGTHPVPRIPR